MSTAIFCYVYRINLVWVVNLIGLSNDSYHITVNAALNWLVFRFFPTHVHNSIAIIAKWHQTELFAWKCYVVWQRTKLITNLQLIKFQGYEWVSMIGNNRLSDLIIEKIGICVITNHICRVIDLEMSNRSHNIIRKYVLPFTLATYRCMPICVWRKKSVRAPLNGGEKAKPFLLCACCSLCVSATELLRA